MVMTEIAGEVAGHSPSQKRSVRRDVTGMLHVELFINSFKTALSVHIYVSVDGTFFKCLLFMTSYNTSYLRLRPVPSK